MELNVYLDTNIYRGLGIRFSKHRDYEYLHRFLGLSDHRLGLLDVVEREIIDYYKKDVFGKLIAEHTKSIRNINENPYFAKLPEVDFTALEEDAFRILTLDLSVFPKPKVDKVPSELLVGFLLQNKAEKRADNARDFLIFYTLIDTCLTHPDAIICFISKDRIFKENAFFAQMLLDESIDNLEIYDSIPAFLNRYGPQIDWVTKEMVLAEIDSKIIEGELLNDINCFPSYVSNYYYDKTADEIPDLENLSIKGIEVSDFYITSNPETKEFMVNAEVRVSVKILYGISPDPESLMAFFATNPKKSISKPETFDSKGRVIFEEDVLFFFEGSLNEKHKRIENFRFIDFFPDGFRYEDMERHYAFNLVPIDPY